MGSAEIQGELWGRAPREWAELQEPMHYPLWEAMLTAAEVSPGALEELIEWAGLKVAGSGQAVCVFEYPTFGVLWQANASAGPLQAALRSVSEDKLRNAVKSAVAPYERTDGSIRMENQFRYVVAMQ